ncbi:uncharacterized protein LOC101847591 [Aplysia californica]|uniref:Uncharacterized protein LOC101847591 n=1 Tax=Aplysia californica TaxID=6500 RepID=A0ABM1A2U2_APLCA|nr:uncharacterized protein LOC101847591 [Aplysia californica]
MALARFFILLALWGICVNAYQQDEIAACLNNYTNALTNISNNQAVCGHMRTFFVCYFRVLDFQIHGTLSADQKRQLQEKMDEELRKQGITCDFTFEDVADDLARGSATVTSPLSKLMWGLVSMVVVLLRRGTF